ncbi:hypothetical protein AB6A40_008568 [Gnathostoma spinigerum]|uniref:Uncharacterized protein n=1 Tax=Gnathostoma spinigerum TaxID=75299 RepID=A0ABD6EX71_9BILA
MCSLLLSNVVLPEQKCSVCNASSLIWDRVDICFRVTEEELRSVVTSSSVRSHLFKDRKRLRDKLRSSILLALSGASHYRVLAYLSLFDESEAESRAFSAVKLISQSIPGETSQIQFLRYLKSLVVFLNRRWQLVVSSASTLETFSFEFTLDPISRNPVIL